MSKLLNIQGLRGIAALLVVCFHLLPIEEKYGDGRVVLPDFFIHGMFGVDLFFVISGFIMVSITKGQFQHTSNALSFLYHRASRIYPTYWFYSSLVLIFFLIRPEWVNSAQGNHVNIISSFLLWPEETLPLINVGWTLIHEVYFYMVFSILLICIPEKRLSIFLFIWGALVVFVNLYVVTDSSVIHLIAHPLTMEFIAGALLAILYHKDSSWKFAVFLMVASVLFSSILILFNQSKFPSDWWRVGIYGTPAAAILYCLVIAERRNIVFNKYLVKIGDASYSIYLLHILVLSAVGRVIYVLSSRTEFSIPNYALLIVLLFCVIISGLISYRIIERPLLKISRKLYESIRTYKSNIKIKDDRLH